MMCGQTDGHFKKLCISVRLLLWNEHCGAHLRALQLNSSNPNLVMLRFYIFDFRQEAKLRFCRMKSENLKIN